MRLFAQDIGVQYWYVESDFATIIPDLTGRKPVKRKDGKTGFEKAPIKGDIIASGLYSIALARGAGEPFPVRPFQPRSRLMTTPDSKLAPITPSGSIDTDIRNVKALLRRPKHPREVGDLPGAVSCTSSAIQVRK